MIVTAALYARVSTPNQEEEATIDSQVAAIERYMQDRGYDLTSEFYFLDKAVSGARLDRPALDRLRHLASDGAFAMVVCYSPDRLSRSYPHQWVRLLDAFQDGLLNKTELSQRKQRLEQERQTIAERVEQIQRQQKQQSVKAQIIDEFSAFCASAQKALENPTPEVKQEVLRLLVESIVVEDNTITIKHIVPTDDNSRLLPWDKM